MFNMMCVCVRVCVCVCVYEESVTFGAGGVAQW
jgi:hypothetical protein